MAVISRQLRVFLCHASPDKPHVRRLYESLRTYGIDVWLDAENLLPGQDWDLEIARAVRASDAVIVCLSPESVAKSGYVQKEIRYALDVADRQPDGTIFIVPARLRECTVPDRIRRWHWVDLFSEDGLTKLLASLSVRADSLDGVARLQGHDEAAERKLGDVQSSIRRDLGEALRQQLFRSAVVPDDVVFFSSIEAAESVGADFVDSFELPANRFGILVGDVAGKALPAAFLSVGMRAAARAILGSGVSTPSAFCAALNRALVKDWHHSSFAAIFFGDLDPVTLTLTWVSAGWFPPLLCRERVVTRLTEGQGVVLGVFDQATFEDATLQLVSGDVLLLYSDGIIEAVNEDGEEFGEERVIALVSQHAHLPLQDLCTILHDRAKEWGDKPQPADDLLLVGLRV